MEVLKGTIMIQRFTFRSVYSLINVNFRIALGLLFLLLSQSVMALSPGDVTIELTSGTELVSDSNQCSPPRQGPDAAYVAFKVTNTSEGTLTDMGGTMTDPSAFTGFAFAGGQPATIYIGSLIAGQSRTFFWFIEYPCHDATVNSADLAVTIADSNPGTVSLIPTVTATSTSSLSASAGGEVDTFVLGPGYVVGQVVTMDVTYDFGNIQSGDHFIFQPAGNNSFDAGCFQLIIFLRPILSDRR